MSEERQQKGDAVHEDDVGTESDIAVALLNFNGKRHYFSADDWWAVVDGLSFEGADVGAEDLRCHLDIIDSNRTVFEEAVTNNANEIGSGRATDLDLKRTGKLRATDVS